jgi:hypothetical protein
MSANETTAEITPMIRLARNAPIPMRTWTGRSTGVGAPWPVGADGAGA